MKNQEEQYIKIPKRLWADKRFTPIERMMVSHRLGFKDFFASNESVAKDFGVSKKAVCECYKKARLYGFLPEKSYETVTQQLPNGNSIVTKR